MRVEPSIYEAVTVNLEQLEPARRFGRLGRPIPATETYRRVVSTLLRAGIRVEKWVLVNERDHTVTFSTTYNGIAGRHFDAVRNTQWLSWENLRPRLENYQFVPPDECPIAAYVPKPSASASQRRTLS